MSTDNLDDTLSAIDHVVGPAPEPRACPKCGGPLAGSVSADFCSEMCQDLWHAAQATVVAWRPEDEQTRPDAALPETTPARPMTWLGAPPSGAFVREGHEILDAVTAFVARFNVFPSTHCAPTLALWYAHTHAADRFYVTPRLILDSAEPGSGKTRVLEVAQYLVAAPEMTISSTPAAIFRMVTAGPITLLFDEVDAIFNPKSGSGNEDLRALLNAGYKRSATVARCVGDAKAMKVERFKVYAPAALAGIAGGMPATITTRAITFHMRKRAPDEPVDEFDEQEVEQQAAPLRAELAGWISRVAGQLGATKPVMPAGVTDRAAEIWRPLLTLADLAGGRWPDMARSACTHFVLSPDQQPLSWGVRLLADLRDLFTRHDTDRLPTAAILAGLCALDEAPWAEFYGKPLDARRMAKELARYGVKSKDIKLTGGTVAKGYRTDGPDGLADVWRRYLPMAATPATRATEPAGQVADSPPVALPTATEPASTSTQVAPGSATHPVSATHPTSPVAHVAPVAPTPQER